MKRNRIVSKALAAGGGLVMLTLVMGMMLAGKMVRADDSSVVQTSITVPVACTLRGTGTDSHTATLAPNTYSGASGSVYENGIGKTTLTAICNDDNGFSIYAIGYTGNSYDSENHTKLVGNTLGGTIATKAYASGDTTSNWSMKLTKVTDSTVSYNPTNLTISTGYDAWHAIPDTYTKVAQYKANTGSSTTDTTLGVKLETTYAAFIASNQPADTYVGQVKYTMVHPYNAAEPVLPSKVGVTYHANGSTFSGGTTTNRVVYANSCETEQIEYKLSKSSNIYDDGTRDPSASIQFEHDTVQIVGASKLKVVITYGMEQDTGNVWVMEGPFPEAEPPENVYTLSGEDEDTYYIDGDMVTFVINEFGSTPSEPNYGYYAKVYPMNENDEEYAFDETTCTIRKEKGTYVETADWYGSWYADINGQHYDFMNELELTTFLGNSFATLGGTNIDVYRSLTINEAYAKANKMQSNGYYIQQDMNNSMCQTVAIGQNGTVGDGRDNNIYMIGRLKDGRCWMLDNLALDPTDSITAANMNANNTNATAEAITNYLNGGSSNTGWSNTAVANVALGSSSYVAPMIYNASKDTLVTSYGPASTNGQAKVGIYYNYCAATVGTYCYAGNSGVDVPNTIIDAPQDICPANWRMPTGGANGEYKALSNEYNTTQDAISTASLQYNLSTTLSGYFVGGTVGVGGQGSRGEWWSSTNDDGDGNSNIGGSSMHILRVLSNYTPADDTRDRRESHSMRCLVSD